MIYSRSWSTNITNLEGANLYRASLIHAFMDRANLKGAKLYDAHLEHAGLEEADEAAQAMQLQFQTSFGACHMPTGTGNQLLGAPNLTDDTWLYGSSMDSIRTTIADGRMGEMPPHGELLG